MTRRPVFLLLFWLVLAAVTWLALAPITTPMPDTGWDKANHALAFAVLAGLGRPCWPRAGWKLAAALLAYGIAIEVAQSFTPTRTGDPLDVLADAAGLAIAWALARVTSPWRR